MKITSTGTPALAPLPAGAPAAGLAAPAAPAEADASTAQGALLRTARAQLQQMPEIDLDKVAQVRAALERGEISFDPAKLAGLIARYHGSKS